MNWVPAIIFGVVLVFNVGIFIGYLKNHSKHIDKNFEVVDKKLDQLFTKANANTAAIAKIEGRLNNKG